MSSLVQNQSEPHTSLDGSSADQRDDINLWTGFRLLLPFARYGWVGFVAAAFLAALAALASLGPFWVLYQAVDGIVAGEASLDAMYRYAAMAAVFIAAQYTLTAVA